MNLSFELFIDHLKEIASYFKEDLKVKTTVSQNMLAKEYGFADWQKLSYTFKSTFFPATEEIFKKFKGRLASYGPIKGVTTSENNYIVFEPNERFYICLEMPSFSEFDGEGNLLVNIFIEDYITLEPTYCFDETVELQMNSSKEEIYKRLEEKILQKFAKIKNIMEGDTA